MKQEMGIKVLLLLLITSLSISACSDDDPTPGCYQKSGRKIVAIITDIEGAIVEIESCGLVIRPDVQIDNNPVGLLNPCNLGDEFKEEGIKVVFSGYIYESFETEDICADFFEITEMRLNNP